MRKCIDCGVTKNESEFYANKKTGQPTSWCKACNTQRCAVYRRKRQVKSAFENRTFITNMLLSEPCFKCGEVKNISEFSSLSITSRKICEKCEKEKKRNYKKNRLRELAKDGKAYEKHLKKKRKKNDNKKRRDYHREYYQRQSKEWKKTRIEYCNMLGLVRRSIVRIQNNSLNEDKIPFVGCTDSELKAHFENLFYDGMDWDNYGKAWTIDHIQTYSSFDLSKDEDKRKYNHYTNLRPLSPTENYGREKRVD